MQIVEINKQEVRFDIVDGQTFASSKDIAKVFEKRHDNIIRDIRAMPQDEFHALNFEESTYLNEQNKEQPLYEITRDGFSMLVMGFTGQKAYEWKVKFIEAFNMLEQNYFKKQDDGYKDKYIAQLELTNALLIKQKAPTPQRYIPKPTKDFKSNSPWSPNEDEILNEIKEKGYKARHILERLNRTIGAVFQRLRRNRNSD